LIEFFLPRNVTRQNLGGLQFRAQFLNGFALPGALIGQIEGGAFTDERGGNGVGEAPLIRDAENDGVLAS
jgi:hypothetical protein